MTRDEIIKEKFNLRGANLYGANLRDADLRDANLRDADLSEADLREADLSGANLYKANLYKANLSGADLSGADLRGADLRETDLSGAKNIPSQFKSNLNILRWQKSKLIAFKYLNKDISPYQSFKYEIGKEYSCENGSNDDRILCDVGISLASLEWCLQQTNCDLTKTYAIFEYDPIDILSIPYNSDGKFRVKEATYIRNLTEDELRGAIKPLYEED